MTIKREPREKAISKEDVIEYALETGERMRLVSLAGGYRHKQIAGRRVMLELGNPAILLLLAYLFALPGIVVEFFLMKELWYFGFDLYSLYVFILATSCVAAGFYLIFRSADASKSGFRITNQHLLMGAIALAAVCLFLLIFWGRESAEIAILLSIGFVIATMLALRSTPNIEKIDALPVTLYGMGIVIIAMIPVHHALDIWSTGEGELNLNLFDWALLILGVSLSLIAINSVRTRMGFFSCWLFGAMIVALVTFHEIAVIYSSSSFEVYDQALILEGTIFSVIPLALYFTKEWESARIWSHLLNATKALDRKSYERALKETEKAIEILSISGLSNKLSLPWSIYGDIYFRLGKFNKARTWYDMALSIDPRDTETLSNLGSMLAFKGYGNQALSVYQEAAALAPHDPRIWNNLGVIFLSLRMHDEALAAFRKTIQKDDSFSTAYYNTGMILLRSGKPAAALRHFRKLLQLVPDDEKARRAYERAEFVLGCLQQTAGWKKLGLNISVLMKTVLQNPGKFEERHRDYVDGIVQNLSYAFDNDRDRMTVALQTVLDKIKLSGQSIQSLRTESELTLNQLRFCIAVLLLSKRAEFRNINNSIWLVPKTEKREEQRKRKVAPSHRSEIGRPGSPSTI